MKSLATTININTLCKLQFTIMPYATNKYGCHMINVCSTTPLL